MIFKNFRRFRILIIDDEVASATGRVLHRYFNPSQEMLSTKTNLPEYNKDSFENWTVEVRLRNSFVDNDQKENIDRDFSKEAEWDIIITDFYLKNALMDSPWLLLFAQKFSPNAILYINTTLPEIELYAYDKFHSMTSIEHISSALKKLFGDQSIYEKENIHKRIPEMITNGMNKIHLGLFPKFGDQMKEFRLLCIELKDALSDQEKRTVLISNIKQLMDRTESFCHNNMPNSTQYQKINESIEKISKTFIYQKIEALFNFEFQDKTHDQLWCFSTLFPFNYAQMIENNIFYVIYLVLKYHHNSSSGRIVNLCKRLSSRKILQHSLSPENCIKIIQGMLIHISSSKSSDIATILFQSGFNLLRHGLKFEEYINYLIPKETFNLSNYDKNAKNFFLDIDIKMKNWDANDSFKQKLFEKIHKKKKDVLKELENLREEREKTEKNKPNLDSAKKYNEFKNDLKEFRNHYLPEQDFNVFLKEDNKVSGKLNIDIKDVPFPEVEELKKVWYVFEQNVQPNDKKEKPNDKEEKPMINVIAYQKDFKATLVFSSFGKPIEKEIAELLRPPFKDVSGYKLEKIAHIFQPFGRFLLQSFTTNNSETEIWTFDVFSQRIQVNTVVKEIPEYFQFNRKNHMSGTAYIFEINTYFQDKELCK